MLGAAYKQDIDDYRESPAIRVMEEFRRIGALVDYYDPFVPRYRDAGQWYESIPVLTATAVKAHDLICITTAHTNVDYEMVCSCGILVFDCKNVCRGIKNRENIEVL